MQFIPVDSVRDLAFTTPDSMWHVDETTNYVNDNIRGKQYAAQLIDLMTRQENPTLLGRVAEAMIKKGRYGAVEIGFWHYVAERISAHTG